MLFLKEFVLNAVPKSSIKNAQTVTILKNNSYVWLKTQKLPNLVMVLRYLTLTTSSTFPQFHSKMSLLGNQIRNSNES
jgi:hypothetical protein